MTKRVNAGKIGAEALEQGLELRNDVDQQDRRHDDGDDDDGGRIEQGLLDLLLDGLGLFFVGGDLVEQRLERAGLLAGRHEAHEQVVEVVRVLRERFCERGTAFDVALDREDQLLHGRVLVTGADDVERLHERDAGGHHRGELAREDGDVARRDLALLAEQHALLAHARRHDALAAQLGRTAASLVETTLPLTFLPVRSVPSQVNGAWVAVAVAILQGLPRERVSATGPSAAQFA